MKEVLPLWRLLPAMKSMAHKSECDKAQQQDSHDWNVLRSNSKHTHNSLKLDPKDILPD